MSVYLDDKYKKELDFDIINDNIELNLNLISKYPRSSFLKQFIELISEEKLPSNAKSAIIDFMKIENLIDMPNDQMLNLTKLGYEVQRKGGWIEYLKREKNKVRRTDRKDFFDFKVSKFKYHTFWWFFGIALIGFGLSVYNFTENLLLSKNTKQQAVQKNTTETETEKTDEKVTGSNFTVLPFDPSWHWIFKDVELTELSQTEIDEIELILENAIIENNKRQEEYLKKHNEEYPKYLWTETRFELDLDEEYYRQYVPVINEKGEKEIWVNFFCSTMKDNWKTNLVMVHDGGNCFFNIKVNLTNKTYSDLRINGHA